MAVRVVEAGRLDVVIAALFEGLSRTRASDLVKSGQVQVDGVVVDRPSLAVAAGAWLEVAVPAPVPLDAAPQDLPLRIVFEDADVVVIDKAAGMVVHPAPGHEDGTVVNALLHHVGDLSGIGGVQRPGIVHRLDRGTSGLLVVAKNDAAHQALSAQFAAHTARRRYVALCLGEPGFSSGTIQSRLARHPTDRMRYASTKGEAGREAVTHWELLGRAGTVSLIGCVLETGRTHQVRVHLSEAGWPIVGDPLYGRKGSRLPATLRDLVDPDRPLLHAWSLAFDHPRTGARIALIAPAPEDLVRAAEAVGLRYALPS